MQYLLDEEEYQIYKERNKQVNNNLKLALVLSHIRIDLLEQANFICIHDRIEPIKGYCDNCPCSGIANNHNYEAWKTLCGLQTYYSK